MKIIKFGGKSLANGEGINNTIAILEDKLRNEEDIFIVLSARGDSTDQLESILEEAKNGGNYLKRWRNFKAYQSEPLTGIDLEKEFQLLEEIFQGIKLTRDYSQKIRDLVLAQGEILASLLVTQILNLKGFKSIAVDSRSFLKTDDSFGDAVIDNPVSERKTINYFNAFERGQTPVITGFIASGISDETTTLGRNGSNYTASLLANYLDAEEVQSYTHVDGIYTANPELVNNAKVIEQINYTEANELASFGASILHAKTIAPLAEKNIPLHILNTFNRDNKGTIINNNGTKKGIKSISVQHKVGLINVVGKDLLGKIGVDARIFTSQSNNGISIGIISQGSSERGVSFVVGSKDLAVAKEALISEFKYELLSKEIQSVNSIENISVITIVGQNISDFSSSLNQLRQNKISILLINNTLGGNNISIIIHDKDIKKAVNIIHSQIFGIAKKINIAIFGKGTVGGSLIDQILDSKEKILAKKETRLNIFAILGSEKIMLDEKGFSKEWKKGYKFARSSSDPINEVIRFAENNHLENLVAIDNTGDPELVENYIPLLENSFDIITSNKIANTRNYSSYEEFRQLVKSNNRQYLYETTVGAGLPIIDTIRILHEFGENITKIKGVFSGSMSFVFNQFSNSNKPFSYWLTKAIELGFTEPDPREDLSGKDVARKLLILARELDLKNEYDEIQIENLIPTHLQNIDTQTFLDQTDLLNPHFHTIKESIEKNEVLRYIAELSCHPKNEKGKLTISLKTIAAESSLGNLKGSDSIFKIYTESYGDSPITIMGAGAGAKVTARGVFGDLLRIAEKK